MTEIFSKLVNQNIIYFEVKVKDMDRAKKFYHDVFGLDVVYDAGDEAGWCSMSLPVHGVQLALQLLGNEEHQKGSASLIFSVPDIEAVESYLHEKGITTRPIHDIPNMVSLLIMQDPDENEICFAGSPRIGGSQS